MLAFFEHVRGQTDDVPLGYDPRGLAVYRHLVHLGAAQVIEAQFPQLRAQVGEDHWRTLVSAFVRDSKWQSHFLGDLSDEFLEFLSRESR
jgi:hypothetical protein